MEEKKHVLVTLKLLKSEAMEVKELPPDVPFIDPSKFTIVKMRCKYCGKQWSVHAFTLLEKKTWCPLGKNGCGAELYVETAIMGERPVVKRWMPPTAEIAIVRWFATGLFPSAKDIAEDLDKKGYKVDEDTVIKVLKSELEGGNILVTVRAKTLEDLARILRVSLSRLKEL